MRLILLAAVVLLVGCDSDGLVCTTSFESVEVRVVDSDGVVVEDLVTTVTNTRTQGAIGGRRINEGGRYTVLSDTFLAFVPVGQLPRVRSGVRGRPGVPGTGQTLSASAEITVGRDGCHVQKLAGLDEIVAEPSASAQQTSRSAR